MEHNIFKPLTQHEITASKIQFIMCSCSRDIKKHTVELTIPTTDISKVNTHPVVIKNYGFFEINTKRIINSLGKNIILSEWRWLLFKVLISDDCHKLISVHILVEYNPEWASKFIEDHPLTKEEETRFLKTLSLSK
jgi:hypothetical protein